MKNDYCSHCGARFPAALPWPRRCPACQQVSYRNPLPVAVLLLPFDGGLLLVRRAIPPQRGELALPGGFIEIGESWQAAAAREANEELGVTIDPAQIALFDAANAPDGTLLVFGIAPPLAAEAIASFVPNSETLGLAVIHAPAELAFPLHTAAALRYFQKDPANAK